MTRIKIDHRIRLFIENGIQLAHRTMFIIVGDKGRDQIVVLHHILSKSAVKAQPSVLWCYKKELGFSCRKNKRMKRVQQKIKSGSVNVNDDDPFEIFIGSTDIRYCYYTETQKILGNTYGMCVLQDFEALTPNLLARTIETVEGGGLVIILLRSLTSLKQLYTMSMDVHDRYRSEAHNDVVGRFNERFLLSLSTCTRCLVTDDQLNVLPISSHILDIEADPTNSPSSTDIELRALKESFGDTPPIGVLVNCCRTNDQAKALLMCINVLSEKSLCSTISLTASRGRGKSAALGLSVAAAIAFRYSNIFVTSPSPENLKTFFELVFTGLDVLGYKEHLDFGLVRSSNPEYNKAIIRVNIFRENRQTIQYIHPREVHNLSQAELLVIDEAAAIPLPCVKAMLGPYLIFLSSTINGYEGTGRSLSLKLLEQLRNQCFNSTTSAKSSTSQLSISLEESIRYKPGDEVEKWLTGLLCLDATNCIIETSETPPSSYCDLYYINRDTLFSYHEISEAFLQRLISLFVASHYKNSPNDLQMMSDAPAHHLFCLLGPLKENEEIPVILCAIQVCLEGQISNNIVSEAFTRGKKAAGDLIPWSISQQFLDEDFPSLSGARIVRIATHPDYQCMGYGLRALSLLKDYYGMKLTLLDDLPVYTMAKEYDFAEDNIYTEKIEPRENFPPLLLKLSERPPEKLDYLGVSYGLTLPLLKFWKRGGFIPLYVRQTANDLTGEHSCIMLITLENEKMNSWLPQFWEDFRRRFTSLLSYRFCKFPTDLALEVVLNENIRGATKCLDINELYIHLTKYDIKRIELYCNNGVDYHLIMDLMPVIAKLYFNGLMGDTTLSSLQRAILLGLGLQHKTIDPLSKELGLPASQVLGLFNRMMRKLHQFMLYIIEGVIERDMVTRTEPVMNTNGTLESMSEELNKADKELKAVQKRELKQLKKDLLNEFAIRGSDEDWNKSLTSGKSNIISVKRFSNNNKAFFYRECILAFAFWKDSLSAT
ncbi:hypothetical protein AAG570_012775 [Ranatra chinensis]|uniref:RNA cytidine acetyltransferase n=1 Tax=Ranatra chinensis TaxID=642074 RepID=A0ABD0YF45_9HEMI